MTPFDPNDLERSTPSSATPRCAMCEEAALPRHDGYCFRHAFVAVPAASVLRAIAR